MREVLVHRGVGAARIETLADGVPGAALPTRANILEALDRLAAGSGPGDTVVVHFSGHGSREPAPDGSGLRPIFLPFDVGPWNGEEGRVTHAISADELRDRIDRIADRGAFVWAIFDACHSAALVRGTDATAWRYRSVQPAELGVPEASIVRAAGSAGDRAGGPPERGPRSSSTAPQRGGTAFFYASQADELTPELPLPEGTPFRRFHGLFSYTISLALEGAHAASYRQLGQFVLAAYGSVDQALATPLFSGDGLDSAALGSTRQTTSQWPLLPGPAVDAGRLSGILPGSIFAVASNALDPDSPPIGHLRVVQADAAHSELEPSAFGGQPAPRRSTLKPGEGQFLRLVQRAADFGLRVALDARGCDADCPLQAAMQRLRAEGVAGVALQWVAPTDAPDILLRLRGDGVELLAPAAQAGQDSPRDQVTGVPLHQDGRALQAAELAGRIGRALHAVARVRNLLALAARRAAAPELDRLVVRLHRRRAGGGAVEEVLAGGPVPLLHDGDLLSLQLSNEDVAALDVTVLYLDAGAGVTVLFPDARGAINRIEAGARLAVGDIRIYAPPSGRERLLVMARRARRGAERADFSFLAQATLTRQRGDADDDMQIFEDAAFATGSKRGAVSATVPSPAVSMRLFTVDVRR